MPVGVTRLTFGIEITNATSVVTKSVTVQEGEILCLAIRLNSVIAGPLEPSSIVGLGSTWVVVDSQVLDAGGSNFNRLSYYRTKVPAHATGTITITWATALDLAGWGLFRLDGVNSSGENGANAFVQTVKAAGSGASSPAVTLAAFESPNNRAFVVWGTVNEAAATVNTATVEAGYQAVLRLGVPDAGVGIAESMFVASSKFVDRNPTATFGGTVTTSATIASELRAAAEYLARTAAPRQEPRGYYEMLDVRAWF